MLDAFAIEKYVCDFQEICMAKFLTDKFLSSCIHFSSFTSIILCLKYKLQLLLINFTQNNQKLLHLKHNDNTKTFALKANFVLSNHQIFSEKLAILLVFQLFADKNGTIG